MLGLPLARLHRFQSTLPARGATTSQQRRRKALLNFNPRSPHGERREASVMDSARVTDFNPRSPHGERLVTLSATSPVWAISIHAPRTGSDGISPHCINRESIFQSTLPARGATWRFAHVVNSDNISIHAPRTGSDEYNPIENYDRMISIHAPRTGSDIG